MSIQNQSSPFSFFNFESLPYQKTKHKNADKFKLPGKKGRLCDGMNWNLEWVVLPFDDLMVLVCRNCHDT
jgi:hypothetical protein